MVLKTALAYAYILLTTQKEAPAHAVHAEKLSPAVACQPKTTTCQPKTTAGIVGAALQLHLAAVLRNPIEVMSHLHKMIVVCIQGEFNLAKYNI